MRDSVRVFIGGIEHLRNVPKNGRPSLLAAPGGGVSFYCYDPDYPSDDFEYWMEIPKPPVSQLFKEDE